MTINERIGVLTKLGEEILSKPLWLTEAMTRAYHANKWFTKEESWNALEAIAVNFLSQDILTNWASKYKVSDQLSDKKIGLVLAGNIPMVGFHDILCCFMSGHISMVKLSSKDEVLLTAIVNKMIELDNQIEGRILLENRLKGFDAVIATGSNNSSTYFEEYFGKYPNIIRKNRNAVGVITGNETDDEIIALGHDIFNYFGLGCRNVSKLYVPKGYKFDNMLKILHEEYKELANHDKYRNNFDYNNALMLLNKVEFLMSGSLIITESSNIPSRISTVHYSFYDSLEEVTQELNERMEEIQCVVGNTPVKGINVFPFGEAQKPSISDYADGVDTMQFLTNL